MPDDELDRIKKKQLDDLLKQQQEQQAMHETTVMDLNSSNFTDTLLKNKLLLVDFWAEWCSPCKSMHPIFSRMAKKYRDIASKFNVQSIPTFIMFNNGKVAQQMVGAVGEPGINMICKKFSSD